MIPPHRIATSATDPQPPEDERARTWLERIRDTRAPVVTLGVFSFGESTVIPVPLEAILIPMMLVDKARTWRYATSALIGCVAGALLGYVIGDVAMATLGHSVVEQFGWQQGMQTFDDLFAAHGFWAIVLVGVVPIPFQVATLAAGAAGHPLWSFLLATLIARGIRYFGLAWLVERFGERARHLWGEHKLTASALLALTLLAIWGLFEWVGHLVTQGT